MAEITLRQIRYFVALSKALQYQAAARQLGISQPSLTIQIKALEEAVGGRLVERKRGGLILTPLGRDVVVQAENVLGEVEALTFLGQPEDERLSGTLRLGSSPTVGPYLLPRVLRRLHAIYPDLKMVIRDGPPRALSEGLSAGQHDMILSQLPLPEDDLRVQSLYREPLSLAVPRDHALTTKESVSARDLAGESMLSLSAAYAMNRQIAAFAQSAGAVLREDFEGTSLDALRQMVSLGMGITLLPALYVQSEVRLADPDVVTLPVRPAQSRTIGLAWRISSGQPPAFVKIGTFIRQIVKEEFADVVTLSG